MTNIRRKTWAGVIFGSAAFWAPIYMVIKLGAAQ